MEELQDAIEDAQYVNAIATQEEGPRPVLAWEIPTEEQLAEWDAKIMKEATTSSDGGPKPFEIDWCLESAIGLFLFSSYLKDSCNDYLRINFSEEVIRWKKLRGKHRVERAKKIVSVYLKERKVDEVTGEKVYPEMTRIDEYDLTREVPKIALTDAEFDERYSIQIEDADDDSKSTNCLCIRGPVLEEIIQALKTVDKDIIATQRKSSPTIPVHEPPQESGNGEDMATYHLKKQKEKYSSLKQLTQSWKEKEEHLEDNFFDKVEAVVIESLRRDHWVGFLESEQYTKMRNFIWFLDRLVVPDDFFTMRVLGRGGFGSVIGTFPHTMGFCFSLE
jgi:hypothetical protein